MKNSFKTVLALALIAAGVLWILCILGVISFTFSTKGWWTLFIIVPCAAGLFNGHDRVGSCIGIGIGVLLLLAARGVITWHNMWQLGLAVVVIGFGVRLLLNKGNCGNNGVSQLKTVSRAGKEVRIIESSFGKQNLSFAGERFEGADVKAAFGAISLDLNGADIAEGAFVNVDVGFAGVTIIVPENLPVRIAVTSGFGGVSDNRRTKVLETPGTPSLIIMGKVGFGGLEIRN